MQQGLGKRILDTIDIFVGSDHPLVVAIGHKGSILFLD